MSPRLNRTARWLRRRAQNIAALLLATMFICFLIQILSPLRHQAGGAGSRRSRLAQDDDTTAQFTAEGQSFLRPSSLPRSCGPDPELAGCWGCSMLRITVWLPVRVLPAPPRTPTLTEISRGLTNTRGFAGTQGGLQSLLGRRTASEAVRGVLSLATKNRFPGA